ncbi:hypothetical protein CAAN1_03S01772 [[Candida] anglica]|uniref:RNase III domain-containing protein n=1 Tax=[Candida] anglica TaxID=148631 RepID=A0ABP0EIX8_9ASCO
MLSTRLVRRMRMNWRCSYRSSSSSSSNNTQPDPALVSGRDLHEQFCMAAGEPQSHPWPVESDIKYYSSPDIFRRAGFLKEVESRTDPLKNFIGSQFPLSVAERMQVICGLTTLPSSMTGYQRLVKKNDSGLQKSVDDPPCSITNEYSSDHFRSLGRRIYEVQLRLIVFDSNYLSMAAEDIENNFALFADPHSTIIPFMKRNTIYDCILPFKGTSDGKYLDREERKVKQGIIRDTTAIASFYTLLGMLCLKFGTSKVAEPFIRDKIILGSNGIVNSLAESMSRTRSL